MTTLTTTPITMATAAATTLRLGPFTMHTGEPFIVATRENDPDGGTFAYPQVWGSRATRFVNWHFDWDVADPMLPDKPHGRVSYDGGRTWQKQTVMAPPGYHRAEIGPGELMSFKDSIEIPGKPGHYLVATWRSGDNGRSWSDLTWTPMRFPGTRGLDMYDPPAQYRLHSLSYKGGQLRPKPPDHLEALFRQVGSRRRGPHTLSSVRDAAGNIYLLSVDFWLRDGDRLSDAASYWEKLDWTRRAILMQKSSDCGRTWNYAGVVAFDEQHKIAEFDEESCFAEPSMVIYPDGEMVCALRTGGARPLYLVRSTDGGKTWSEAVKLPIRGVDPHLAIMSDQMLVLATGRPHCTIHFSQDRGKTWPVSQVLFRQTNEPVANHYSGSTSNVELTVIDEHTLLYIHDAARLDADAPNRWLQRHGFGRMIGRFITIAKNAEGAAVDATDQVEPAIAESPLPVATAEVRPRADLTFNGKLDSAFWRGLPSYQLCVAETGKKPVCGTSFQVAWAKDALYFGIRCDEPDMASLHMAAKRRGDTKLWADDCIELLLQTQVHTYYQIAINPVGTVVDVDRKDGLELRWSSNVEVAAHRDTGYWALEVRVPIAGVGVVVDPLCGIAGQRPTEAQPWRINVCRQRPRGNAHEVTTFSPTGFPWFHELTRFGTLYVAAEGSNQT